MSNGCTPPETPPPVVQPAETPVNPANPGMAENDTTKMNRTPISITNDRSTVRLIGLFFNESEIRAEDEPESGLTIEKDVLDRSTSFIFGRFAYKLDARGKGVFAAYLDGVFVIEQHFDFPRGQFEGYVDIPLFLYPDTAKANKDGIHKLHVDTGVITGIVEGNTKGKGEGFGLVTPGTVRDQREADFTIKLLPHKIVD